MSLPSSNPARPTSVALLCDIENRLVSKMHDDLGLGVRPGDSVLEAFDPQSRAKALEFLHEARGRRAAFGWELHLRVAQRLRMLHFCASLTSDGLLVVGAELLADAAAQHARYLILGESPPSLPASEARTDVYEQLSALNNELLNAQRELSKVNAALARANAEKAQLVAMIAHDLRSPLNVVALCSTMLLDPRTRLDEDQRQLAERVQRQSDRMRRLVQDLLVAFSLESGALQLMRQPVDLVEAVRRNVQSNALLADKAGLRLTFESGAAALPATLDPVRIDQVLDNLIQNAIKFSPPGTAIAVHLAQDAQSAEISVADQGPGIAASELAQVFEAFRSSSRDRADGDASFGLGLAIVKSIIERHGGAVSVESALGRGATFRVRLPLQASEGAGNGKAS